MDGIDVILSQPQYQTTSSSNSPLEALGMGLLLIVFYISILLVSDLKTKKQKILSALFLSGLTLLTTLYYNDQIPGFIYLLLHDKMHHLFFIFGLIEQFMLVAIINRIPIDTKVKVTPLIALNLVLYVNLAITILTFLTHKFS